MPNSKGGLELLVDGLFDYAGMFPPASLSFDDALTAAISFPRELKRPALVASDFVVSFEHLSRLRAELLQRLGYAQERPFSICVLGSSLQSESDDERAAELADLVRFDSSEQSSKVRRAVVSYELKVGPALQADHHILLALLRRIQARLQDQRLSIFLEPDLSVARWKEVLETTCGAIQIVNSDSQGALVGLKVRASGPTAVSPHKLSAIIAAVAAAQLHFKATAGLHHPIVERARYQNELGFLNLAAALFLKRHYGSTMTDQDTLACLTCEQASHYRFEDGVAWKQYRISPSELNLIKKQFHFSVGSCSLHEPDQDLLRLFG